MSPPDPDVTLLVPTFRRPDGLRRLLAAVAHQRAPFDWEVVVVDNDVAGSAKLCVEAASQTMPVPVRYVEEPETGAVHARNRGIREATGRVVAMLDDDVVPQPGWLASICAPVLSGEAGGAGGRVVLDPEVARPRWFDEPGLGGYLTAHSLGDERRALTQDEIVVTANAAFVRAALVQVGGFDPRFGPRGHTQLVADDAYLVRQLIRAGQTVLWIPDAVVVHDLPARRLTRTYLLRRAYWQGRSDWLLASDDHRDRRLGGARVAATLTLAWLRLQWSERRREGLRRSPVLFHLACDLGRVLGTFVQLLSSVVGRRGARRLGRQR